MASEHYNRNWHAHFSFIVQSSTITTAESADTVSASSTIMVQGFRPAFDYFWSDRFAINMGYMFSYNFISSGIQVQGGEIGIKYFPLSKGSSFTSEVKGMIIEGRPRYAPYIIAAGITRDYKISNQSFFFAGIKMGLGLDYHWKNNYIINAEAATEAAQASEIRTQSAMSIIFSLARPL